LNVARIRAGRAGVLAALAAVAVLAGCQARTTAGESGRDAELARVAAAGTFRLVSVEPRRAVVDAAGQRVAVVPAANTCIAEDAIDLSERSAFLLLADCAAMRAASTASGVLDVAPGFPGLVTLSIAGAPRGGIGALLDFLRTPEGRAQLARSDDASAVLLEETREIGDVLYVHARQADEAVLPLLSRDFWRAFVDLDGRMGVITVSGFGARDPGAEAMFGEAHRQVTALATAGQGAALTAKSVPVEVPSLGRVGTRGADD
jgi:hypothetical protein